MIPSRNNSFQDACSFLQSHIHSSGDSAIDSMVEQMNQDVAELHPGNPNKGALSQQRKGMLEKRVITLFKAIEKIGNPTPPLKLNEIYAEQLASVKKLSEALQQFSPIEFHKELKKVHPDVRKKIYEMTWIASGCPKKELFSETFLKNDPSILKQVGFPSFTGSGGGTLLQQVEADLYCDFQINQNHVDKPLLIKSKVEFFQSFLADKRNSHVHLKAIFKCMHPEVQSALNHMGINPPFYGMGVNFEAYRTFGAHYNGYSRRTTFRVYAPNARKMVLNLTAFGKMEHSIEMNKGTDGIWTANTDQARPGRSYHYMITGKNGGEPLKKVDPFAFRSLIHDLDVKRENHESVVVDIDKEYPWTDGAWMASRANHDFSKQPLSIYEIHSPSWKLSEDGKTLNWRDLAPKLAEYCKENYYNALELMAMFSHPQPTSMGYQITNFFAPHPEMGSWQDFQFFIDYMHNKQISVFADWVPAHFAIDGFALCDFDGSAIFEDDNPTFAYHSKWGTRVFDFSKQFTQDFLASNASFILRQLHIDGLRVDAVASMLYLNFEKPADRPFRRNWKGTDIDLHAKVFLRHLNTHIHNQFPGVLTMAEESDGFANIVRPANQRGERERQYGLGFDFTWHMGFMKDSLEYWQKSAAERRDFYSLFTNSAKGVDGNNDTRPRGKVILPYSHDENANGKGTILTKMWGSNREEKFANGRLALAYQLLRGGGPILDFMGNNILQSLEWHGIVKQNMERVPEEKPRATVQWEELDPAVNPVEHQFHTGAALARRDLNELFLKSPGLWDQTDDGFSWIDATDNVNCVMSFHRKGENGQQFACIFNTSDTEMVDYKIPLPISSYAPELLKLSGVKEVYNTDDVRYGGKGRMNGVVNIIRDGLTNQPTHFELCLPPYSAVVLEEKFS